MRFANTRLAARTAKNTHAPTKHANQRRSTPEKTSDEQPVHNLPSSSSRVGGWDHCDGPTGSALNQRPTSRPQLNNPGPEPLCLSVLRSKLRHLGRTVGLPSVESGSSTPLAAPLLRPPAAKKYKDQARSRIEDVRAWPRASQTAENGSALADVN